MVYFDNYQDDETSGFGPYYLIDKCEILDDLSALRWDDAKNVVDRYFVAEPLEA